MINIQENHEASDWAIAIYTWLSQNYNGQNCEKYAAMSKMSSAYGLDVREGLDDMTQVYHDEITEENWENIFSIFCKYMDEEYDKNRC